MATQFNPVQLPKHYLQILQEQKEMASSSNVSDCSQQESGCEQSSIKPSSTHPTTTSDESKTESSSLLVDKLTNLHISSDNNGKETITDQEMGMGNNHDHDGQQLSAIDYYCSTTTNTSTDKCLKNDFDYVLEVYGFNASLITKDLLKELYTFGSSKMKIKWVDDTHALAIYSNARDAYLASKGVYSLLKVKPLAESDHIESIAMAEKVAESIRSSLSNEREVFVKSPREQRPPTTSSVARRMVGHALGVKINVPPEKSREEKLKIDRAKHKKQKKKETIQE